MARKNHLPLLLLPQFETHLKRHHNALKSISDKPFSHKKKVHSSHSRYLQDLQGIKLQLNREMHQMKLNSAFRQEEPSQRVGKQGQQQSPQERISINKKVICLEGLYFFNETFLHRDKVQVTLKNVQTKESFTLFIPRDHCTSLLSQHCSGDLSRLNQLIKINHQGSPYIAFDQKESEVARPSERQLKRHRSNLKINRPLNITLTGQSHAEPSSTTLQPQIIVRRIQRLRQIHKEQALEGRMDRAKSYLPPMKSYLIPS